jgi:glycine hydroxymethyltransferase
MSRHQDRAVWDAVAREAERQERQLELIASENHTSREVMDAMGTVLTNKYAEGYPGRRYYGGCEHVDDVEDLCRDRAKELFGAERANVQPHSGTQANIAALMAMCEPGDRVLGMSLDHGGHLSHGHSKNFSGIFYEFSSYGVERGSERIDMDRVREQALEVRPKVLLAGASAYSRVLDFEAFRAIADECGALLLVDMAHIAGLVAAGVHPSPVPHAAVTTMTTHKTLRGPRGGLVVCGADWIKTINSTVFPGGQGGPLMHVIAAKAVALREALQPDFRVYGHAVVENAATLAAVLIERGLRVVSGGTDNHLLLVDLQPFGVTGKVAQEALDAAGITCNKNAIPNDPEKPFVTSGLRLGTAAVTTAGMGEPEMAAIASLMARVLRAIDDAQVTVDVRDAAAALCSKFVPYPTA